MSISQVLKKELLDFLIPHVITLNFDFKLYGAMSIWYVWVLLNINFYFTNYVLVFIFSW